MFKGHPKGLYVAFLANMGERFGFYTMMGILVLFLQAKFNLSPDKAGLIYSIFYFSIYALALFGGFVADRTQNYKGVVATGVIVMFVGYLLLAVPGLGLLAAILGLGTIALGNGMFKGNLQAMVGQMYDNPEYSGLRDSAYSIFYMGINIGAMFAPSAASAIQTWWLRHNGYAYDANLPALCNKFIAGTVDGAPKLTELADIAAIQTETASNLNSLVDLVNSQPEVASGIKELADLAITQPEVASKLSGLVDLAATQTSVASNLNELADLSIVTSKLSELATLASNKPVTDLVAFAKNYLEVFSTGYNYAFGIAGIAMLISLVSYITFKRHLPEKKKVAVGASADVAEMPKAEERQRLIALGLVFLVVIFFWMSFHQNGLTMTFFARDYTEGSVSRITSLAFNIWSLLSVGLGLTGLVLALKPASDGKTRAMGALLAIVAVAVIYFFYNRAEDLNKITPVLFQQFNAFFVVFLTPIVVGFFAWLRSRGKEPSAPRKIGIGMIVASLGFVVLMVGSFGLQSPATLDGAPSPHLVSSYWLINSYLVLTFAELFLSPMGISFVSKVAPPRFQGLMQGCWLGATAIGNQLLFVGSSLWTRIPVWGVWLTFIICCLVSATVIWSLMKRLEKVAT
ncbi:MAG: peptide MFS transporter [Holophagaceae bacterium]|nr:peptide MFS transporter [Holophagaceae bacterium]